MADSILFNDNGDEEKYARIKQELIDIWYREEVQRKEALKKLTKRVETIKEKKNRMLNEQTIESEINDKGLNAPRLTPDFVDSKILTEDYHIFEGTCLTVCCLTLVNGFHVIGESACASPENFDVELGRKIAKDKARNKIWELEGYLLREKLSK